MKYLLFLIALYGGILSEAHAASEILRAVTIDYKPWGYYQEKNKATGAFYDAVTLILDRFEQQSGIETEHRLQPLARAKKEMLSSTADLAVFTPSPATDDLIDLGVVFEGIKMVLLPRAGVGLDNQDDLLGLRVAIPRGADAHADFLRHPKIKLLNVNRPEQMVDMLLANRVDVAVETNITFATIMREKGLRSSSLGMPYVILQGEAFQGHLWMSKASDFYAHRKRLEDIVTELRQSGQFQIILNEWLYVERASIR